MLIVIVVKETENDCNSAAIGEVGSKTAKTEATTRSCETHSKICCFMIAVSHVSLAWQEGISQDVFTSCSNGPIQPFGLNLIIPIAQTGHFSA